MDKISVKNYQEKALTYKNPFNECEYPWTHDPLGYCWGYAIAIDDKKAWEFIKRSCPKCDLWKKKPGGGDQE